MRHLFFYSCVLLIYLTGCSDKQQPAFKLYLTGLDKPVEIYRDSNGVNHIYAQTEHDLFFAQGYAAATDRLFQLELWRRQATGTVAEWLGRRELKRDIGARLFQFRGNLKDELNHYHPRGEAIIRAFVDGINTRIDEVLQNPQLLPPEFLWLNTLPGKWTPEVVVSRHQGLVGNLTDELTLVRAIALLGAARVKDLLPLEPGNPQLEADAAINLKALFNPVIELYEAYRKPVIFLPEDVAEPWRASKEAETSHTAFAELLVQNPYSAGIGSNNWVLSGSRSVTGMPLLANDPHRAVTMPSLRYMVHLSAPGWHVAGGGEPAIPGVSIGHNDYGAWGLTVFSIDSEDLMVYELNPQNHNQYRYQNQWEDMRLIYDTIKIKHMPDTVVVHRYTRHGPVTYTDAKNHLAYAVRCAWLEKGCAPYLASLRMNTATSWEEFRDACSYSYLPGENMIWADRNGTIGWQVVGIAPIRKTWDGLLPVPGDGRYEWEGYLPVKQLPNIVNPPQGFWVTANENLTAPDYPHRYAVGWQWADSSRGKRIREVLQSKPLFTVADMMALQTDYTSLPARTLTALIRNLKHEDPVTEKARLMLSRWNGHLGTTSVEAGIYMMWERTLTARAHRLFVPVAAQQVIRSLPVRKVIEWVKTNRKELGNRDTFLMGTLHEACRLMQKKFGPDMNQWQYGQENYHHVLIRHPLYAVVNDSLRAILQCGPYPRGGSAATPGATGNGDNQTHGATFRMVADVANWDNCWFTNAPGQSGYPTSPFFKNLFEPWAADRYFRMYFSKEKIKKKAAERLNLIPSAK